MPRCQFLARLLIVLWALAHRTAYAEDVTLTFGTPVEAGMTESVLQAGLGLYQTAVANDEVRGAVLLVARHGKVVLYEALGWRDVDRKLPMQRDSLFRMASNTKPVVAAAALMLVEEGRLGLDDFVHRHLPSFDSERGRKIRVRHLLSHTSGLRIPTIFLRPVLEKSQEHPDAPSLRAEVDRFGAIGAEVPPGTSFSYSNPGYNTLAALIEEIEQAPLDEVLRRRFYQPLGMTDSSHAVLESKQDRMCCVYKRRDKTWNIAWKPGDPPEYPFVRGSGGLISTAWDYARFCQMFLNGGIYEGRQYVSAKSIDAATAPHTRSLYSPEERRTRESFYGWGWVVSREGIYSHTGSDGTFAWVDPHYNMVGLVLTQSAGGKNPRKQFARVMRAACEDAIPAAEPAAAR